MDETQDSNGPECRLQAAIQALLRQWFWTLHSGRWEGIREWLLWVGFGHQALATIGQDVPVAATHSSHLTFDMRGAWRPYAGKCPLDERATLYCAPPMSLALRRSRGRQSSFARNSSSRTQPDVLAAGDSTSRTACDLNRARMTSACCQRLSLPCRQ
jgi:hypothetical protein